MPASCFSSSMARCVMPPVPAEPQVILPGLAFAAVMKSLKLLMPSLAFTTSSSCTRAMRVSGAMSFFGS